MCHEYPRPTRLVAGNHQPYTICRPVAEGKCFLCGSRWPSMLALTASRSAAIMRYTNAGSFPGVRRGGGTVDTGDLKSPAPQGVCEFKSRPRHRADPSDSGTPAGYLVDDRADIAPGPGALVTGRIAAAGVWPWRAGTRRLATLRCIMTRTRSTPCGGRRRT